MKAKQETLGHPPGYWGVLKPSLLLKIILLALGFTFLTMAGKAQEEHGHHHQKCDSLTALVEQFIAKNYRGKQFWKTVKTKADQKGLNFKQLQSTVKIHRRLLEKQLFRQTHAKHQFGKTHQEAYAKLFVAKLDECVSNFKNTSEEDPEIPFPTPATNACENLDFESCNFSLWSLFKGEVDASPFGYINVLPTTITGTGFPMSSSGSQHNILSSGIDPLVGIPMVRPGGSCSAMLGDGYESGGKAASMSRTFTVTANNANFYYSYAIVMENPGHSIGEQPYFRIRMKDQNGNNISCADLDVYAGDGNPDWKFDFTNDVDYIDWQSAFIPLQSFVGQTVTIEFTSGDCDLGGHFCYAYVEAECNRPITLTDTATCKGNPVTISAPAGARSYLWNNGETTRSITVNKKGMYKVTMEGTAGGGCFYTDSIWVGEYPEPTASFSMDKVCLGTQTQFNDLSYSQGSITNWNWDFDNDGFTETNVANPKHIFAGFGNYTVHLEVQSNNGCLDDTSITATVYPMPTAGFTVNPFCAGDSTQLTNTSTFNNGSMQSLSWKLNGHNPISGETPWVNFDQSGNYSIELVATDVNGCADSITHSVTVWPNPKAGFTTDTVCFGTPSTFTNTTTVDAGTLSYLWAFGDGTSSSSINPSHTYSNSNAFATVLIAQNSFGCIDTAVGSALIHPMPTAEVTVKNNVGCSDLPVEFEAKPSVTGGVVQSVDWLMGNDFVPDEIIFTHWYVNDGNTAKDYDVNLKVTSNKGCIFDTTLVGLVTVYPSTKADFIPTPNELDENNKTVEFFNLSTGADSVFWHLGNGYNSTDYSPTTSYPEPGEYTVKLLTNNQYNCADTVIKKIFVKPSINLFVPNTFTPNNDGRNDNFTISQRNMVDMEMIIFNRWGDPIFKTNDMLLGWNGYINNRPAQIDTYVYKIITTDILGEKHELVGHVNLIR